MGARGASIVLIGLRRAGKSTVGARLAARLGRDFVDLDDLVAKREGASAAHLLVERGELEFRRAEWRALQALRVDETRVLAAGGGTPLWEKSRETLRRIGRVLYLAVSVEELGRRLARDQAPGTRPLLAGKDAQEENAILHRVRDPIFRECADCVVGAEGDVDQVVEACLRAIGAPEPQEL